MFDYCQFLSFLSLLSVFNVIYLLNIHFIIRIHISVLVLVLQFRNMFINIRVFFFNSAFHSWESHGNKYNFE